MADKINILIVEDESIVALDLAQGLENDGYEVAGIADCAEEAKELFSTNEVDIILMDINIIGEMDGIDTAIELLKQKTVPVIFLTAFTDAATIERAKHIQPAAFLAKPYSLTNVRIAIELAINNFAVARQQKETGKIVSMDKNTSGKTHEAPEKEIILQMDDHIFVKNNYAFIKVKLSELLYLEADNNYVHLVTPDKKFALRLSLSQVMEKINYKPLVRIHRSFAVNMNAVQSFNEQEVQVSKIQLPIGRNYKEEFMRHFNFS